MSDAMNNTQDGGLTERPVDLQGGDVSHILDSPTKEDAQRDVIPDQGASPADMPPVSASVHSDASVQASAAGQPGMRHSGVPSNSAATAGVIPANEGACGCNGGDAQPVFFIGELSYDFGTEARRDSFKQQMPFVAAPAVQGGEIHIPPNPYDHKQMADHLESDPEESTQLIWTANLDLQPLYAIEPAGPYAESVYDFLRVALKNQIRAKDDDGKLDSDYVERISVAGELTGKTVRLFSGQTVPVIKPRFRLLFAWQVNLLIGLAVDTAKADMGERSLSNDDEQLVQDNLRHFLDRIYYDLRNLGVSARERAINYAATNAFQVTKTLVDATKFGYQLSEISAEKSPFCRMYSDCWDVKLRFFDPENVLRAKRVVRFTVDVSDRSPVSVGDIRTWTEA